MGAHLSASPRKEVVEKSLTALYALSSRQKSRRLRLLNTDLGKARFIIFSDQHKGNRSGADDFAASEKNYIAALEYYHENKFTFINLGDSEELWKFKAQQILPVNKDVFKAEAAFQPKHYYKTFGNHDLIWKNKLDVIFLLKNYFKMPLPVYEAVVLRNNSSDYKLDIFLTHGHQGDLMSDNNALSTWIVAHLWLPLQRYLQINVNSPSKDFSLKNRHNRMMYDWSSKQNGLLLITGHTHCPVFASGKYSSHPSNEIEPGKAAEDFRPTYFNTGCCCFNDGDITGIEISDNHIRLIKWYDEGDKTKKRVLEEVSLPVLINDLSAR